MRRNLPLLILLAYGMPATYFAGTDGLRELQAEQPTPTVRAIAVTAETQVVQARAVLKLPAEWTTAMLQPTGARVDPSVHELSRQSQGYLAELRLAQLFLRAYGTTAVALTECGPDHPYNLALKARRDDLRLVSALDKHRLGDADSLRRIKNQRRPAAPSDNRELDECIDALEKLEVLRARDASLSAVLSRWVGTWDPKLAATTVNALQRRGRDHRQFAKDFPHAASYVRLAAAEAKKSDDLIQALAQLGRNDKADTLENLRALHLVLALFDPDQHPSTFTRSRRSVLEWCAAEVPSELSLDKVWIGSPRKSAFGRSDVKIEWPDGAVTTLDQPYRGVVYDEEALQRFNKSSKSKITITTPLGSGSPDDLIASEATTCALAFNRSLKQLKDRLVEPTSYQSLAEAFRAVHSAGSRLDANVRARLANLAAELERLQTFDR